MGMYVCCWVLCHTAVANQRPERNGDVESGVENSIFLNDYNGYYSLEISVTMWS